jgi:hypothetical protein
MDGEILLQILNVEKHPGVQRAVSLRAVPLRG